MLWAYFPLIYLKICFFVVVYISLDKLATEMSRFQSALSRLPSFRITTYIVHFLRQISEAIKAIMIYFQHSIHRYCISDIYNILGATEPFINNLII